MLCADVTELEAEASLDALRPHPRAAVCGVDTCHLLAALKALWDGED